ncbi:hypothetical protein KIN20_031559 [Parelaphostrongylus tenuis]|uniref:Uncharacterized protein n=1 Tax=Parelaphostrongylus tenuis TaxID=148309 RepID=A0AAD5R5M8_PARTN|nr:hypothetical protein KIN20_031559 [Parelaphostrongylus tenuis]
MAQYAFPQARRELITESTRSKQSLVRTFFNVLAGGDERIGEASLVRGRTDVFKGDDEGNCPDPSGAAELT